MFQESFHAAIGWSIDACYNYCTVWSTYFSYSPSRISGSPENLSREGHHSWYNVVKTGKEDYVPSGHRIHKLLETKSAPEYVQTSDTLKQRKGFGTYCRTRSLKNPQRIQSGREGLSNVKIRVVNGTKLSIFWRILWTLTTPSGSKKDFKSSSDSEAKSSCVTTPLQGGLPPLPGGWWYT